MVVIKLHVQLFLNYTCTWNQRLGHTMQRCVRLLTARQSHESRDEFRPGMEKKNSLFSSWNRPARVEFISSMPSQALFTHGTFIPGRPFTWELVVKFHPWMPFHPGARYGGAFIPRGKSSWDQNSHVNWP